MNTDQINLIDPPPPPPPSNNKGCLFAIAVLIAAIGIPIGVSIHNKPTPEEERAERKAKEAADAIAWDAHVAELIAQRKAAGTWVPTPPPNLTPHSILPPTPTPYSSYSSEKELTTSEIIAKARRGQKTTTEEKLKVIRSYGNTPPTDEDELIRKARTSRDLTPAEQERLSHSDKFWDEVARNAYRKGYR